MVITCLCLHWTGRDKTMSRTNEKRSISTEQWNWFTQRPMKFCTLSTLWAMASQKIRRTPWSKHIKLEQSSFIHFQESWRCPLPSQMIQVTLTLIYHHHWDRLSFLLILMKQIFDSMSKHNWNRWNHFCFLIWCLRCSPRSPIHPRGGSESSEFVSSFVLKSISYDQMKFILDISDRRLESGLVEDSSTQWNLFGIDVDRFTIEKTITKNNASTYPDPSRVISNESDIVFYRWYQISVKDFSLFSLNSHEMATMNLIIFIQIWQENSFEKSKKQIDWWRCWQMIYSKITDQ